MTLVRQGHPVEEFVGMDRATLLFIPERSVESITTSFRRELEWLSPVHRGVPCRKFKAGGTAKSLKEAPPEVFYIWRALEGSTALQEDCDGPKTF